MKIILYKRDDSFLSKLVSFVTRSEYTHSAILLRRGKHCYFSDSSLEEGKIIMLKTIDIPARVQNREFDVFDINTADRDCAGFTRASELSGGKYDTTGAVLWTFFKLFGITNKNFYCFEYTIEILKQYYTLDNASVKNPSGDTVKKLAEHFGTKARFLNCGRVN